MISFAPGLFSTMICWPQAALGFSDPDLTWDIADSAMQRTTDSLERAGSRWVRLDVQWRQAEPSRGSYDQWWIDEYVITNKRVIIKLGVLNTRSIELLLPKVEGIEVTQSLTGRLFGYGEIIVTGSGGTKELFEGIQTPLDFRQAVQAATDSSGK